MVNIYLFNTFLIEKERHAIYLGTGNKVVKIQKIHALNEFTTQWRQASNKHTT